MSFPSLLHLHPPSIDLPLLVILLIAAIISAVLLGLALAAYTRRRSRSYLIILLAIATLFARTAVAGFTVLDMLSATEHHLIEHALDVALAAT